MNTYSKSIIPHPDLYIVNYTKKSCSPHLIFIHGGPGLNCGVIEYLIEHYHLFDLLDFNIVLYDQRNCGKSNNKSSVAVAHEDNLVDLNNIIEFLTHTADITIYGLIGHSYGAKLLFDFYQKFDSSVPGIFLSLSDSILTPRLNNLMIDLAYLKKENPSQYNDILKNIDSCNLEKIWEISQEAAFLFKKNKERVFFYWANLEMLNAVTDIQNKINLPMNDGVFNSVRKGLYSDEKNLEISLEQLGISYLSIKGFHDFIMNNGETCLSNEKNTVTFFKSAHYPHIEENALFCELTNKFIAASWSQICEKQ
jgi:proline iminopeptidase